MWSADGIGLFAICGHYINEEFQLCSNYAHITEQIRGTTAGDTIILLSQTIIFLKQAPTVLMPLSNIARFLIRTCYST
jgi:hypothetical protein